MKRLINYTPSRGSRWLIGLVPFGIIALAYLMLSNARLAENPNDRLLPSPATMVETFTQLATQASVRTWTIPLWDDTFASLERLGLGIAISALIGLVVGVLNGGLPLMRAKLSPLVTVVSLIPPMAILPVLFIAFGTGEMAKVALIVIGVAPFLVRDLQSHAMRLPDEQLIKAQTLHNEKNRSLTKTRNISREKRKRPAQMTRHLEK